MSVSLVEDDALTIESTLVLFRLSSNSVHIFITTITVKNRTASAWNRSLNQMKILQQHRALEGKITILDSSCIARLDGVHSLMRLFVTSDERFVRSLLRRSVRPALRDKSIPYYACDLKDAAPVVAHGTICCESLTGISAEIPKEKFEGGVGKIRYFVVVFANRVGLLTIVFVCIIIITINSDD